jgi:hypothetical protein
MQAGRQLLSELVIPTPTVRQKQRELFLPAFYEVYSFGHQRASVRRIAFRC